MWHCFLVLPRVKVCAYHQWWLLANVLSVICVVELNCTVCVVVFAEQIAEESTVPEEPVKVEEVAAEEVKPADLQFLTPVTPQLHTTAEKELQLE